MTFQPYETDLELEAQKLRESGASAVLVLTSIGLNCSEYDNETSVLGLYNISSEQSECNKKSILFKLINNIKPDVIDGIIAGDYNNEIVKLIRLCKRGNANENTSGNDKDKQVR